MIKRICALLLGAALLLGSALAEPAGLDWAAGDYLNDMGDLQFSMTAKVNEFTPYGQETVAMMNALLPHLSLSANVNDTETGLTFRVAGDPIVSLTETHTANGAELTTDLLPNRVLTGGASAMDGLSGLDQQESQFDFFAAIQQAEACYQQLTDAIQPYAEEKAANYSIKNVGSSRWSRIARLTPEQGAELQPLVARVLGCGMDKAFRDRLSQMEIQKGFIVGLYQTREKGSDLAVYIKGNVLFPDGAQRAISYQWAFAVNDKNQRVDAYKFDMTKNNAPRDNRQITGSLKRSADGSELLVKGQSKAAIRSPETNALVTTTTDYDLKGKAGAVEGSWVQAVRTAQGETASTETLTVTPKLMFAQADGSAAVTGSVLVEKAKGNTTHLSMELLFDEKTADDYIAAAETGVLFVVDDRLPQSSLSQNMDWTADEPQAYLVGKPPIGYTAHAVPEGETIINLDSADANTVSALMDEMTQRLAGNLLIAVAKLPDDATALIRDLLSDEDYAAFLALLD